MRYALGIDAGGTQTRWALLDSSGEIAAEGEVRGFSATQVRGADRSCVVDILGELARAVLAAGRPGRVHAGLTGFGGNGDELRALIAAPLELEPAAVTVGSDIETMYLDLFAPGKGYVIYAGTGSVAAFMDEQGQLHRVGGRGVTVDDAGSGFWIGRAALRSVWRAEEENPGSSRDSALAAELFALVGGSDWSDTRRYVYEGTRGDVGRLALAVARAADRDEAAREILRMSGRELARLARIMIARFGPRPVAVAGRAAALHPLIFETMRSLLPDASLELRELRGHRAAAHLALRAFAGQDAG
jgi:N-acetylglucosamine kinase-like BadF-type ATPase